MKKPKSVFMLGYMTLPHWLIAFLVGSTLLYGLIAAGINIVLVFVVSLVYWFVVHGWYNRRFDE